MKILVSVLDDRIPYTVAAIYILQPGDLRCSDLAYAFVTKYKAYCRWHYGSMRTFCYIGWPALKACLPVSRTLPSLYSAHRHLTRSVREIDREIAMSDSREGVPMVSVAIGLSTAESRLALLL